ncbi:hypothetical protein BGP78_11390 [Pseudoalteromonas sp. MSK9-3]|uniref:hypothetical protein n=1 Tax=Pseudoalteromonas sp. MSK9-3 TaxID=1897633 RepID=UPI000E6BD36A|nr:hypothetical protein [Pseudoalteromonas sp. MSK9-3]RJE76590.1 hypothetical protein BGP78_11390 [Pseudoalteromonas sp. MSK9-3]
MKLQSFAACALLPFAFNINAAENTSLPIENNLAYSVYAGITTGGDELIDLEYENGPSQSIKAGGLINLGAGAKYTFNNLWSLQTNLGYHFDSDNADNADISFSRWALDIIPYYQINDAFKVGVGITYHLNTEFEVEMGSMIDAKTSFESSAGLVASVGYQFENPNSWVELRIVSISYNADKVTLDRAFGMSINETVNTVDVPSIDGNHIGLTYHYVF